MTSSYFPSSPAAVLDAALKPDNDAWMPALDEWLNVDSLNAMITPPTDVLGQEDFKSASPLDYFPLLPTPDEPILDLFQSLAPASPPQFVMSSPPASSIAPPAVSSPPYTTSDASTASLSPKAASTSPSPPLEIILTLDPAPARANSSSASSSNTSKKRKLGPPSAAKPVASHVASASTPTFSLKRPAKKRAVATTPTTTSASTGTASDASSSASPMANASDPDLALKRKRNTDAARRSRQRKLEKMETLSSRVMDLETMHKQLLTRLACLETEKSSLLDREVAYQARIHQLETQLTQYAIGG
ncbi:hypothetical protein BC940DRAFT_322690 [Gongronella butleri]|nr:hypothetical protein BC940DRAFT_322690 [Gongronella butleri]